MQYTESKILCPIHNLEIILLDIKIGIPLGQRACCKECDIKQPHSIAKGLERVNNQKLIESQIINNNKDKSMEELQKIQKQLQQFSEEMKKIFNKLLDSLEKQRMNLESQARFEDRINIRSLSDIQKLGEMVSDLENNKYEKDKQIIQLDIKNYLDHLFKELNEIQNIVNKYFISIKSTKTKEDQLNVHRNNYKLISTYKLQQWVNPIIINSEKPLAVLCDYSGLIEVNFEDNNFQFQNLCKQDHITDMCFGANKDWMITAGKDALLKIWKRSKNNWILCSQYLGHQGSINKIIINETKSQVISAGIDQKIIIWNRKEYKLQKDISIKDHKNNITSLALNDQGDYFASGSADLKLIIWKYNDGKWIKHQDICDQHSKFICDIFFDENNNIYTASDKNIKIWKQNNQQIYILSFRIQTQNQIQKIFYNQKHKYLIILQKFIEIWKISQNDFVQKQAINGEYQSLGIQNKGEFMIAQNYSKQELEFYHPNKKARRNNKLCQKRSQFDYIYYNNKIVPEFLCFIQGCSDGIIIMKNHYDILGLERNAQPNQIKKAYHKLALQCHPDKNSDFRATDQFHQINEAYTTLSKEESKSKYDRRLQNRDNLNELLNYFKQQQEEPIQQYDIRDDFISNEDREFLRNFSNKQETETIKKKRIRKKK
ncbi:unnamed protein product [Paramecium sonneborni]|uniref:J domain-containing protein n=1 Tax=Paramecium sonneborni TaxID=65129 RepID=A0A8S1PPX3_9CILI|nr:unnamed protein product [Paramecium sonneborni]